MSAYEDILRKQIMLQQILAPQEEETGSESLKDPTKLSSEDMAAVSGGVGSKAPGAGDIIQKVGMAKALGPTGAIIAALGSIDDGVRGQRQAGIDSYNAKVNGIMRSNRNLYA